MATVTEIPKSHQLILNQKQIRFKFKISGGLDFDETITTTDSNLNKERKLIIL